LKKKEGPRRGSKGETTSFSMTFPAYPVLRRRSRGKRAEEGIHPGENPAGEGTPKDLKILYLTMEEMTCQEEGRRKKRAKGSEVVKASKHLKGRLFCFQIKWKVNAYI